MQTTQLTKEQEETIKEELTILVLLGGLDILDSIFKRINTYSDLFRKLEIPTYLEYVCDLDQMLWDIYNAN